MERTIEYATKIYVELEESGAERLAMIQKAYGEQSSSKVQVYHCFK